MCSAVFYALDGSGVGRLTCFSLGHIGIRDHGLGGEYRYYGDDGSGSEAGWDQVPGED